jgi:hypothetical protein
MSRNQAVLVIVCLDAFFLPFWVFFPCHFITTHNKQCLSQWHFGVFTKGQGPSAVPYFTAVHYTSYFSFHYAHSFSKYSVCRTPSLTMQCCVVWMHAVFHSFLRLAGGETNNGKRKMGAAMQGCKNKSICRRVETFSWPIREI